MPGEILLRTWVRLASFLQMGPAMSSICYSIISILCFSGVNWVDSRHINKESNDNFWRIFHPVETMIYLLINSQFVQRCTGFWISLVWLNRSKLFGLVRWRTVRPSVKFCRFWSYSNNSLQIQKIITCGLQLISTQKRKRNPHFSAFPYLKQNPRTVDFSIGFNSCLDLKTLSLEYPIPLFSLDWENYVKHLFLALKRDCSHHPIYICCMWWHSCDDQ